MKGKICYGEDIKNSRGKQTVRKRNRASKLKGKWRDILRLCSSELSCHFFTHIRSQYLSFKGSRA
jgi:hypothetical protein